MQHKAEREGALGMRTTTTCSHPDATTAAWTELHLRISDDIEAACTEALTAPDAAGAIYLNDKVTALRECLDLLPWQEHHADRHVRLLTATENALRARAPKNATPGYAAGHARALTHIRGVR